MGKAGEEKSESKPLFNFTTQGTAGSGSLFGGQPASSGSQFNFSFKPATANTQAATGGNSVFSSGSLFGGPGLVQVGSAGSLFGNPSGGLFGNSTGGGLFGNKPTLFNQPSGGSLFSVGHSSAKFNEEGDEDGDEDGEDGNEASNSPPAFQIEGATIPGVTDKPVQLKIKPIPVQ